MAPSLIMFVSGLPSGSTREKELHLADIKSHAARVSYRRPKSHVAITARKRGPATRKRPQPSSVSKNNLSAQVQSARGENDCSAAASSMNQPGPLSILQKGNSDPFHTWAVKLTPRANHILAFIRDVFLPSNYRANSRAWVHSIAMKDEWAGGLLTLQSECCAQGYLLTFLSCIAKISPQSAYLTDHLVLKGKTTGALRRQIAKRRDNDVETINCALLLFGAEVFSLNHREATIHGKMLQSLLQQTAQREGGPASVDQGLMTRFLWNDAQLAQSLFKRTIIDMKWATEMLSPTFELLDDAIDDATPGLMANLDDSIASQPMRTYFIQFRQAIWLWLSPKKPLKGTDGVNIAHWLLGRIYLNSGQLLNQYLDLRDFRNSHKHKESIAGGRGRRTAEVSWATQCCLILGLLLAVGLSEGDCQIQGVSVFPAQKMVLAHLRGVMDVILGSSLLGYDGFNTSRDGRLLPAGVSQNVCLWVLFLGAAQARRQFKVVLAPSRAWFDRNFRLVAGRMGLSSWSVIRSRLTRFVYFDEMECAGSEWVPTCLGENNCGVDIAQTFDPI